MNLHIPLNENHTTEDLRVDKLYRGEGLQVRQLQKDGGDLRVRLDIVSDYEKLYLDDVDLKPLLVVREIGPDSRPTGRLLLGDGYHRSEARIRLAQRFPEHAAEWLTVRCEVYEGDAFTAILLGAKGNGGRGLPLQLADRKKVAELLLVGLAKRGITWSDKRIGRWAGIDSGTVASVREQLRSRYTLPTTYEVETSDGRSYMMTPAARRQTPAAYQEDELLDSMPGASEYIAPPQTQAQQPTYATRSRSNGTPTGPRGSGDYRSSAPAARQPAAAYTPPAGSAARWGNGDDEDGGEDGLSASVGLPVYEPYGSRALVPIDEHVTYSLSWSRVGPDGRPEHGTYDQDTIASLPQDIKARLLRDLGVR